MTIKFVLTVATFSQASENAVERAAEIAAHHHALLYVVHRPTSDARRPSDYHYRLSLRSSQLERRHGIAVKNPVLSEEGLLQMLERAAQEIVVVVDRATARQLTAGMGFMRNLAAGLPRGSSFLDVRACPILVVNRPSVERYKAVLLPYETAQDANRSVALARQVSAGTAREMFFVGPQHAATPASLLRREPIRLSEWPPPGLRPEGTERVVHSNYLSTRLNRAILAFDTASMARRIRNQANFSGADLVIAPYVPPTLVERVLRRSLRERLTRDMGCDLAFLPDPDCHRTAPMACERLARQGNVALFPLAPKERSHG
ncbi:MAG TPA: hypothetical protein VGF12_08985 [Roseateles sp.]|uniref:universal stress protein n=1 Tax=Roseateles sp. TaxID=1971397 RepID=UPI002ED86937